MTVEAKTPGSGPPEALGGREWRRRPRAAVPDVEEHAAPPRRDDGGAHVPVSGGGWLGGRHHALEAGGRADLRARSQECYLGR